MDKKERAECVRQAAEAEARVTRLRILVVLLGTVTYPFLMDGPDHVPAAAWAILALGWLYVGWLTSVQPWRRRPSMLDSHVISVADGLVLMAWVGVTGGWESAYFVAMYPVTAAFAFRYPVRQIAVGFVAYAVAYVVMLALAGDLAGHGLEASIRLAHLGFTAALAAVGSVYTLGQLRLRLELERTRAQAERARVTAERASASKSAFLANMSHELRTPLNGVIGMTELLMSTRLTSTQREYADTIIQSGETLLRLVGDILDLSRIEAGRLALEPVPFRLRDSLDHTLDDFARQAATRGIAFVVDVGADVPEDLVGDPIRLRQVLVNLIGNALKFTEQGEVAVRISLLERRPSTALLRFAVSDTGPGIELAHRSRIFRAFEQGDTAISHKAGGTGLGLAISNHLVSMMGGHLELQSVVGHGSTFWFAIPLSVAAPQASAPRPVPRPATRPLRVLLAEDDPVNQEVTRRLLERRGHSIDVVDDGLRVLESVQREHYDVVLMDIRMPDMDGLETTRRIRARERGTSQHVPVVAMTAFAMPGDRERCLAAGMDDYLAKPVSAASLYETVERVAGPPLLARVAQGQ